MSESAAQQLGQLTVEQFIKVAETAFPKQAPVPAHMSPDITELASALAIAQGEMFSPVRNKHVTVTKRKGGTFDWRYSSLDVIMDMIRLPLAQNGLSIMNLTRPNVHGQIFMATRLLHKSGQWIDSILPIHLTPFTDDDTGLTGPQRLGSLLSYAKRYNICLVLGIAGQEDDDANVAEGNMIIDHEYPVEPNAQMRMLQDRYARLVSAAANARDPAGVGEMLQRWQRGWEFWMRMKGDVDHNENFERLMKLIPEALARVHDKLLADCFLVSATAASIDEVDAVRKLWESPDGKAARGKMKELNPISYGMLFEHLRLQAARVERQVDEAARREAKNAERVAIERALDEEGSPFDGAQLPPAPQSGKLQPDGLDLASEGPPDGVVCEEMLPDQSYRQVRNEFGEFVSVVLNEVDWARCYVEQYQDAGNRLALREHNADGIEWARRFIDADVILMQGVGKDRWEQPEPAAEVAPAPHAEEDDQLAVGQCFPFPASTEVLLLDDPRQLALLPTAASAFDAVVLHKTSRGTPDLSRYLRAIKISLEQVDVSGMAAWEEANLPTVDTLPKSTQLAILALVLARKQVLGIQP